MPNIFERIAGNMPKPRQKDVDALAALDKENTPGQKLKPETMNLKELVPLWQKDPSKENTSYLLAKLKPTISSAINSYAQGMEKEMAVPAAKIALNTLKSFDPSFGTDPSTYVFHGLKRLTRISSDRSQLVKYPEQLVADAGRMKGIIASFEDQYGREPSMAELADKLGMSRKKVERLMDLPAVVNDSSMVSDDTGDNLLGSKDVTADDYFEYVYDSVSPIDQKIMEWTAGRHGKTAISNNEIASRLGISAAAVSQRKNRIQQMLSDVRGLV